jgi:hypothetical protein
VLLDLRSLLEAEETSTGDVTSLSPAGVTEATATVEAPAPNTIQRLWIHVPPKRVPAPPTLPPIVVAGVSSASPPATTRGRAAWAYGGAIESVSPPGESAARGQAQVYDDLEALTLMGFSLDEAAELLGVIDVPEDLREMELLGLFGKR